MSDSGTELDFQGLATLRVPITRDSWDIESRELAGLRGIVQRDIKEHKPFVASVAYELYAVHSAPVHRETILTIWAMHERRWDD
jgi:hypothetical protein